jgi:hypothetical protein
MVGARVTPDGAAVVHCGRSHGTCGLPPQRRGREPEMRATQGARPAVAAAKAAHKFDLMLIKHRRADESR